MMKSEVTMKRKGFFLFIVFVLFLVTLIGQLTYIVLVEGKNYDLAVLQKLSERIVNKEIGYQRGAIVDRNGIVLANSIVRYDLRLDVYGLKVSLMEEGQLIEERLETFLTKLSGFYPIDEQMIRTLIETEDKNRDKKIATDLVYKDFERLKEAIDSYKISYLNYTINYKRNYPYPKLASDVIGFMNNDGNGIYGVEKTYDAYLNGEVGRRYGVLEENNLLETMTVDAQDGHDVMLTLDFTIQKHIQDAIDNFFLTEKAKNIQVIVMNPQNGDILGMTNYPAFNLEDPYDITSFYTEEELASMTDEQKSDALYQLWSNEALTNTYEPGSTFKPFVFATALEENVIDLDDDFYCSGSKRVGGFTISCWKEEGHGHQTITEALQNSCNVAFMDVGEKLGRHLFYRYQGMFGFGYQTNIDLSGEVSARNVMFSEDELNVTELATSSFGQGQKITPIQLITGFSSLINGGYLFEPHLMKMVYSEQNIIDQKESVLIRQVISNEVSRITTQALAGVVNEGTGAKASISGYEIGGKTGTAEKLPRGNNKYIVSFIGFAPVENPQVITLVIVDEPEGIDVNSRFAAKIFVDVMEDVMPYLHIFKNVEETEDNQ